MPLQKGFDYEKFVTLMDQNYMKSLFGTSIERLYMLIMLHTVIMELHRRNLWGKHYMSVQ